MKWLVAMSVLFVMVPAARAADVEAGESKVAAVCAACHQAECLACLKPLDQVSYTFTLDQLAAAARR